MGVLLFCPPFLASWIGFNACRLRAHSWWGGPFIGIIMMAAGGFMRTVAGAWVAGSGMVLDPKGKRGPQSRTRFYGRQIAKDALDETVGFRKGKEVIKNKMHGHLLSAQWRGCDVLQEVRKKDIDNKNAPSYGNGILDPTVSPAWEHFFILYRC